jgi:ribosomal protein S18 acetylase RimI-like enzyme
MMTSTEAAEMEKHAEVRLLFTTNYTSLLIALSTAAGAVEFMENSVLTSWGKPLTWTGAGCSASRVAAESHNGVALQDIPPSRVVNAVRLVHDHFRARRQPFHWVVGPLLDADLEQALLAVGCNLDDNEPAMVLDLSSLDPSPATITETGLQSIDITPVANDQEAHAWVRTWAYNAPSEVIDHWTKIYASMLQTNPSRKFAMFIARLRENSYDPAGDGSPIGTGYVWCSDDGMASVQYIVTLPDFRRQGIGRALTLHALQLAHERGCTTAVLTASPSGRGLYERLGFVEFGIIKTFNWVPS